MLLSWLALQSSAAGTRSMSLGFRAEIYGAVLNYYHESIALVFPCLRQTGRGGCRNSERESMAAADKASPAEPRSRSQARTGRIKLIIIQQLLLKLRGRKYGGLLQLSEDLFKSWSPGTHTHTHTFSAVPATISLSSSVLDSLLRHHNKPGLLDITPLTGTDSALTLMASLGKAKVMLNQPVQTHAAHMLP